MIPSSIVIATSSHLESRKGSASPVMLISGLPGVRMEERSPGSYRIAVRGSTIRSPFGIRNAKVYLNEFPLTDAGGNTYLNLIDLNLVNRIDILKGPDGSIFGANSGGVIVLDTEPQLNDSNKLKIRFSGGSFNTYNQSLQATIPVSKHRITLSEGIHSTKGYRDHSSFRRMNFILMDAWEYNSKSTVKLLFSFSKLMYQTPGALTFDQWEMTPRLSRPATSLLPGPKEQNAGVENLSFYSGISHERKISQSIKHSIMMFGSLTDFNNRFITNIEERKEKNFGFRSHIELKKSTRIFSFLHMLGAEVQNSSNKVSNYGNALGIIDTLQSADKLNALQAFVFASALAVYKNKLFTEISAGLNLNRYMIANNSLKTESHVNDFKPQVLPKLEISYYLRYNLSFRINIGRGYSLPSFAEIRPSGNIFNISLLPEQGYNYETGLRMFSNDNRLLIDLAIYNYRLKNAIVRRTTAEGSEYFLNSGIIKQVALESSISYDFIKNKHRVNQSGKVIFSSTIGNHTYGNYVYDSINYKGNKLTGVPRYFLSIDVILGFRYDWYLNSRYNFISELPLNDANTHWSQAANIITLKSGKTFHIKSLTVDSYIAIDNALNIKYSLGYDINAFGGRYYNAAPSRSLQIGITFNF